MGSSAPEIRLAAGTPHPAGVAAPHILLAVDGLARTLGGGERVLLRLAKMLPAEGFRISILTLALDPASPALEDPPCPVYVLPLQRTTDLHALRAAQVLRQWVRRQGIVLVQTFFESSDLWVGPVCKSAGAALIWSRRDLGILRGAKHRLFYRLLRRLPDRVFAVSEEVRRHVLEADGVRPERVETIHNGIDLGPEPEPRGASARLHIASIGNIRPVKGFDLLLEAAAGVVARFPQAQFTIAGELLDGDYASRLVSRARELGLPERFTLLGNVAEVAAYLRTADVFCLPSRSEGLSNALLESMAAGLPAVATAVGGNVECVEDGVSGLLVAPENASALRAALLTLAENPAQRATMGRAARLRAGYLFSSAGMLQRTVTVYRAILAGKKTPKSPQGNQKVMSGQAK